MTLLNAYRVLAYVTATFLLVLTAGVVLKYLTPDGSDAQQLGDSITHTVGIAHGWLFMAYVAVALLLSVRMKWSITMTVLVALAGTIPFAGFFAERRVVAQAHERAAAPEGATARSQV